MPPLNKWIETLSADGRVSDAARVSLEARLAAVSYWLPLAARPIDDDIEKVHQLRVATRRAFAALHLYDDWLHERPQRWLSRRLKIIRRAAGEARDLDVLADWLRQELGDQSGNLLAMVREERIAAQPKIVAIAEKCEQENRFRRKTYRLLAHARARGRKAKKQDLSFRNWAEMRLAQSADRFFAAMPNQNTDLSALHQFRIRGKQLRYALELLAPAFSAELREVHYPVVEELQELLGRINDCVAVDQRLRRWRRRVEPHIDREAIDRLIDRRRSQLDDAVGKYRAWWTSERHESLRRGLLEQTTARDAPTDSNTAGAESATADESTPADEAAPSPVAET